MSKVKTIGVLTSGGDAPGMNAAIRAVVRACIYNNIRCIGVKRGYKGLIDGDMKELAGADVSGIISRGGTMLYTARSPEFMTEEGVAKAAENCWAHGIEGMVVIGGDGTYRGALELSKHGIAVVGVPATIDNDIACTDYTIGFDTACNTAIECIDKLRDTMESHERCSVVEVMGRHAGYLALEVGVAVGASTVLVPEKRVDFQRDVIEPIRKGRLCGRTNYNVVVAEGAASAVDVAERIKNETGMDTRVTILGHIQRGGTPLSRDRVAASLMGAMAVNIMARGAKNRVICERSSQYVDVDINEALNMKKSIDDETWELIKELKMR